MDLMDLMEFHGIQVRMKIKRDRKEAVEARAPSKLGGREAGRLGRCEAAPLGTRRPGSPGGQGAKEAGLLHGKL